MNPYSCVYVCVICTWFSSMYNHFLPQSKTMHVGLISHCKLHLGVNVRMCGCLSLCLPCDRLTICPKCILPFPVARYYKRWMDGWMDAELQETGQERRPRGSYQRTARFHSVLYVSCLFCMSNS